MLRGKWGSCLKSSHPYILFLPRANNTSLWFCNEESSFGCLLFRVTVMVNFESTWRRNAQISGKTIILGVSGRVFLEEISILIRRLKEEICLHQCSGHNPILWGPEWKKIPILTFSLFLPMNIEACGSRAFILWTYTRGPLVLRPSASDLE